MEIGLYSQDHYSTPYALGVLDHLVDWTATPTRSTGWISRRVLSHSDVIRDTKWLTQPHNRASLGSLHKDNFRLVCRAFIKAKQILGTI